MKTLNMPSFGADMETGKVVEWCVKPGDRVHKGDTVALIETAKGLIDMEVFEDGQITDYLVPLDTEIEVGKPLISLAGDETETPVTDQADTEKAPVSNVVDLTSKRSEAVDTQSDRIAMGTVPVGLRLTPAAKHYLAEHPQNLDQVVGSGIANTVCLRDLTLQRPSSVASQTNRKGEFDTHAMRQAIAAVVSKSKREIPHYYLSLDIDLCRTEEWLEQLNQVRPPEKRLMVNVPLMCAVARALHKHPDFNGFYVDGQFTHSSAVHLGLAIRLRNKGLVTPAIHNADQLNAFDMMDRLKSVVERSKLGGLKQSELQDATTTLSNIGDRGTDQIYGVIFPPQVAIIGVGRVIKKPVVVDDQVVVHSIVNLTLSADHRVTDGQMGARFLNEVRKMLQAPEQFAGGEL